MTTPGNRVLWLSRDQVAVAGRRFCEQFITHGGDDIDQLWGDIQVDARGTNDPAVWTDWLGGVWPIFGLDFPRWAYQGRAGEVTDRRGSSCKAAIIDLTPTVFQPFPDVAIEPEAHWDERTAFGAFVEFVNRYYWEIDGATVVTLTAYLDKIKRGEATDERWNAALREPK